MHVILNVHLELLGTPPGHLISASSVWLIIGLVVRIHTLIVCIIHLVTNVRHTEVVSVIALFGCDTIRYKNLPFYDTKGVLVAV